MPTYICRVGTTGGAIRTEAREGSDARALRQALEREGRYVFDVSPARPLRLPPAARLASLSRRAGPHDLLAFNQEFLALVRAGLPVLQALDVLLRRCANPRLREALAEIRKDVAAGVAFSDAAGRHPRLFSHLYVASLRAGEKSGSFTDALARYLTLLKRILAVRKRVVTAMMYPLVLVLLSAAVVAFLLVFVLPRFFEMYATLDAALPAPTLLLIGAVERLEAYGLPLAALLAAAAVGLQRWARKPGGRRRLDGLLLGLPRVGEVARRYSASLFCRTLAALLGGGIPAVPALGTAAAAVGNSVVRERLTACPPAVSAGGGLAGALERAAILPPTALEMIAVGESTGALTEMLGHVADFLDEEVDLRLQAFTALVEPLVMLAMGILVGGIVLVMYLPIFELSGAVR